MYQPVVTSLTKQTRLTRSGVAFIITRKAHLVYVHMATIEARVIFIFIATAVIKAPVADRTLHFFGWTRREVGPVDTLKVRELSKQSSGQLEHARATREWTTIAGLLAHTHLAAHRIHSHGTWMKVGILRKEVGVAFLGGLLLEQATNANTTCLTPKVSAKCIGSGKSSTATPAFAVFEDAFADKFLFTGVEAFVAFPVVLAGKRLAADRADKRPLIGVSAQMTAQVVCTRETLGA